MTEFNKEMVRLAIRGFHDGIKRFEDFFSITLDDFDNVLRDAAERHQKELISEGGEPFMIEVEFLDEPDKSQAFFRFGTDPNGMVLPMQIDTPKKIQ